MRCKSGDIAVIVRSEMGNLGRLVTCKLVATSKQARAVGFWDEDLPVWVLEEPIKALVFGESTTIYMAPDNHLRPIRDSDGEDEMLRIAGLPNKQPEIA